MAASFFVPIALLLVSSSSALAYSTHSDIQVTRTLSAATVQPGDTITVTLEISVGTIGSSPIRGFYISDHVPDSLTADSGNVALGGSSITVTNETKPSGTIHSNCKTRRWVLETPPSWSENNPLVANSTLTVTYDVIVSSGASGSISFPGFSWVAMIPTAGDSGDHFGYEDSPTAITVQDDPSLALDPTTITFAAKEGEGNPSALTVQVNNAGGGTLDAVSTEITYGTQSGWLTVTASGAGDSQSLENSVDIAGLSPNTYSATVKVSAAGAANSPQSYTVSLTVTPRSINPDEPYIVLDPTSLVFSAEQNAAAPPSQSVAVTNGGAQTLRAVSASITYVSGDGWLTVIPSGAENNQSLENSVDPTGLSPDTYSATVAATSDGASNSPQNYTISFTVLAAPDPSTGDAGPWNVDGGAMMPGDGPFGTSMTEDNVLEGGCTVNDLGQPSQGLPWLLLSTIAFLMMLGRRRR